MTSLASRSAARCGKKLVPIAAVSCIISSDAVCTKRALRQIDHHHTNRWYWLRWRKHSWTWQKELQMRLYKMIPDCLLWLSVFGAILLSAGPRALSQTPTLVARDVFHFIWSRDQILKIESAPKSMRSAGDVATLEQGRVVIGNTVVRCKFLTVFFAPHEAADGAKAVGPPGIGDQAIWKVEGRQVMMERRA